MWPLITVTVLTMAYGGYEIYQNLSSPEYEFNRQERRTLDYIENKKDPEKAKQWSQSTLEKGPEVVHKLNPYPTTKDFASDTKKHESK